MRKNSGDILWITYHSDIVAMVFTLGTLSIHWHFSCSQHKLRIWHPWLGTSIVNNIHCIDIGHSVEGHSNFPWDSMSSGVFIPAKMSLHFLNTWVSRKDVHTFYLVLLQFDFTSMFVYSLSCLSYEWTESVKLNTHLRSMQSSMPLLGHLIRVNKLNKEFKAAEPQYGKILWKENVYTTVLFT